MESPRHIAIIMDGNRRWARERGLATRKGHEKGIQQVKAIVEAADTMGVQVLTFYCFSTENWKRSPEEVSYLMKLFLAYIKKYVKELVKKNVRVRQIGRKDRLPKSLIKTLDEAEETSRKNTGILAQFALDYGGRDEIVRTVQKIQKEDATIEKEEDFSRFLDTASNVDLLIRTSGEHRISNFLIWQIAYAEFAFIPEHFPDFTVDIFKKIVDNYKARKRRWGS